MPTCVNKYAVGTHKATYNNKLHTWTEIITSVLGVKRKENCKLENNSQTQ